MARTGIYRLFPDAPDGYNEDNGTLLQRLFAYIPVDRVQTTAAAAPALAVAAAGVLVVCDTGDTAEPPACGPPVLEYKEALYAGNLPALQWYWTRRTETGALVINLHQIRILGGPAVSNILAVNGHLECLDLAFRLKCPPDDDLCTLAAKHNHPDVLRWALESGCEWDYDTYCHAAYHGLLDILQDHPKTWNTWETDNICNHACGCGDLKALQWLRALDPPCPWAPVAVIQYAAQSGHIEVLKWLREQDPPCPMSTWASIHAAREGHLETLQWLHANGCPWDERVRAKAETEGHEHILQWLEGQTLPPYPPVDSDVD